MAACIIAAPDGSGGGEGGKNGWGRDSMEAHRHAWVHHKLTLLSLSGTNSIIGSPSPLSLPACLMRFTSNFMMFTYPGRDLKCLD